MPRTGMSPHQIKNKAVEIASKQMRKNGFEKLKLTDVAREMGISHAALYSHFADKAALFDLVSEKWLAKIDQELDEICEQKEDPCELILEWALHLHRAKVEKVRRDPELYRAFDFSAEEKKPFIVDHLKSVNRQLSGLVCRALEKRRLCKSAVKIATAVILEATVGFHHPKLVAHYADKKRERLLRKTLNVVMVGLELEP